jgi:probable HAF family extracellular repeat protein
MRVVSAPNSGHKISTAFTRCLLTLAAVTVCVPVARAQSTGSQHFFVLDNPGDPNFNQLLGINNADIIAGYFGDGTVVPNNAYVLVPGNHYVPDNFTHLSSGDTASQTQAIGISNAIFPAVVGFYTDNATGFTHGFLDANGTQAAIDDPAGSPPNVTTPVQNLLSINYAGRAAGFWTDNNGEEHGFVALLDTQSLTAVKFDEIPPAIFAGAVATQASDFTDFGDVCGFWTDSAGNNHGFFGALGLRYAAVNVKIPNVTATSTSPFGCNNRGDIVGSFTDSSGNVHGFIFVDGKFHQYDAPGSSQTAAFGVMGTFINGVNDDGDIVGFFSDGTKVNGFLDLAATRRSSQDDDR